MASDYYLQIEGITGESTDSKHNGWLECKTVTWSIRQPKSSTASTSGGHTAERAELSEISNTKLVDLASPLLAQTCACGKTIPKGSWKCRGPMARMNRSSISRSSWKMC